MRNHNIHRHHNHTTSILVLSLTLLTLLSGSILSSPKASADSSAGVNVSVTVPATCSLTANPDALSTTITPGNTGTIGTSTIKAICNDPAGLAVYAVGYTNDTYGNNNLASTVGGTTINIPTAIASSPSTSQWNMTINAVSGDFAPTIPQDFENTAHIIPTQYTKVAYRNTMTDMGTNATGANFTATFTAYIGPTQAAGVYNGKVKFLLVHPNVLTYDDQTGEPDTVQPSTLPRDPEATLYLQDVSTWGDTVALEETVEAVDIRDGQTYKVKRLKMNAAGTESALWMSNLNLGAENLTVTQLDNTNTHLASGVSAIFASTFNSWIKSTTSCDVSDPVIIPITDSNSTSGSDVDMYGNKYGTLYNYASASAGTYAYADGAGTGDATSDLCPYGWRMGSEEELKQPIVDGYSIYNVNNQEWIPGGYQFVQQTLGLSAAGYFCCVGGPIGQGSLGSYWSSTFYADSTMKRLQFDESVIDNNVWDYRVTGTSVRCLADD